MIKDDQSKPINQIDKTLDVYKLINSIGFSDESIFVSSNYYIVEGDILFPTNLEMNSKLKGYRYNGLININNQTNIRVKIDASIPLSSYDWRQAITQSINNFNNIANSRLHFTIVTSGSYDILVRDDYDHELLDGLVVGGGGLKVDKLINSNLPQATAGRLPAYGNPGNEILINLDLHQPLNLSQQIHNITHCLGHCIGLLHADGAHHNGFIINSIHIPSTAYWDNYSIMRSDDIYSEGTFSSDDISSIQYVYGLGKRICLKTSKGYYVQAQNGGGGNAVASSANPWAWETFHLMENHLYGGHPYYVLQCENGKYLQAENGGGYNLVANSLNPWAWESFVLIDSDF